MDTNDNAVSCKYCGKKQSYKNMARHRKSASCIEKQAVIGRPKEKRGRPKKAPKKPKTLHCDTRAINNLSFDVADLATYFGGVRNT